ncbi:MAG: hypothetical protein JWR60_2437 [Polaromonas sp.]|nr:hypothetical protein [Polaromonas sp.]
MTSRQASFYFKGLLAIACGLGTLAHAQVAACRQTQTITVAGQKIVNDQCLQNNGMDAIKFKETCDLGKEGMPALGIPPMKSVYLAACPTQAVNVCEGFGQGKLTSYYYNKDDVAERKQGCEKLGGKFR